MIAQIVRFRSGLSEEEVLRAYENRALRYQSLKGLAQKYYLRYPQTGEYGAVYVWETEEAMNEFHESELAQTIRATYRVEDAPDVTTAEVLMVLRPD